MIYTAAALLVIGLAWLLIKIQSIIIILIIALTLAAAIEPLVVRMHRRGLSRGQAILSIYAGLLISVGLLLYLVLPPLVSQSSDFSTSIPQLLTDLRDQAEASDSRFLNTTGVRSLNRLIISYEHFRNDPSVDGTTIIQYARSAFGVVFTIFSVMVVTYYWLTEKAIIKRLALSRLPAHRRGRAHQIWNDIEDKLGGWTRGQLVLSGVIGGVSTVAYWTFGLKFWLALGILAGITEVIPFLGPLIAGSAAVLVALTDSPEKAIMVGVFVLVLQQVEGAVLVPRVMKNAVGLTPLSIILAVLIGGVLMGPLGSLLAIPVAAAVQVLIQGLLRVYDDDVALREEEEALAAEDAPHRRVQHSPSGGSE